MVYRIGCCILLVLLVGCDYSDEIEACFDIEFACKQQANGDYVCRPRELRSVDDG